MQAIPHRAPASFAQRNSPGVTKTRTDTHEWAHARVRPGATEERAPSRILMGSDVFFKLEN